MAILRTKNDVKVVERVLRTFNVFLVAMLKSTERLALRVLERSIGPEVPETQKWKRRGVRLMLSILTAFAIVFGFKMLGSVVDIFWCSIKLYCFLFLVCFAYFGVARLFK